MCPFSATTNKNCTGENHIIQLNWYAFLTNLRKLGVTGGKFTGKGMSIVILLSKLVCQYAFHIISGKISFQVVQ